MLILLNSNEIMKNQYIAEKITASSEAESQRLTNLEQDRLTKERSANLTAEIQKITSKRKLKGDRIVFNIHDFSTFGVWLKYQLFYESIMTTTSNIVLLIMFVIGVILTATGISMTFSDMIDDLANHSLTPHLLPLIIGIVLIGVSASFGLKKVGKFLDR